MQVSKNNVGQDLKKQRAQIADCVRLSRDIIILCIFMIDAMIILIPYKTDVLKE